MTADPDALGNDRKRSLVDELYRKYSDGLLRALIRQRFSREEAADIVQEAYYRMQSLPNVESIEFPQAFLYRVAHNLARNRAKRRGLGIEQESADVENLGAAAEEPGPYRLLAGEQQLAIVRRAFAELSPKCQRVFAMHRFENLSYPRIAAEMGVSVSMIEKYVSQALAHLRARLYE